MIWDLCCVCGFGCDFIAVFDNIYYRLLDPDWGLDQFFSEFLFRILGNPWSHLNQEIFDPPFGCVLFTGSVPKGTNPLSSPVSRSSSVRSSWQRQNIFCTFKHQPLSSFGRQGRCSSKLRGHDGQLTSHERSTTFLSPVTSQTGTTADQNAQPTWSSSHSFRSKHWL